MQFFPALFLGNAKSSLGKGLFSKPKGTANGPFDAIFNKSPQTSKGKKNGAKSFWDMFENLKAFDESNMPGIPAGFRSTKDDKGLIKSRDLNFLKDKLQEQGINPAMLESVFNPLFSANELPTVGKIMGAARKHQKRTTEGLNEQELVTFNSFLTRIGFTKDEISELTPMTHNGNSLKLFEAISAKIQSNSQNGTLLDLTREETILLTKALDLSKDSSAKILALFGDTTEHKMDAAGFAKLFESAQVELNFKADELKKIHNGINSLVKDMLKEAEVNNKTEANASNRNTRDMQRSETLIRDAATSKSNKHANNNKTDSNNQQESTNSNTGTDKKAGSIIQKESTQTSMVGNRTEKTTSKTTEAEKITSEGGQLQEVNSRNQSANRGSTLAQQQTPDHINPASNINSKGFTSGERYSDEYYSNQEHKGFENSFAKSVKNAGKTAHRETAEREKFSSKLEVMPGAIFSQNQAFAHNSSSANRNSRAAQYQERIFEQVESGILKHAIDGSRQITMRLDPPDLGRLTLSLTMQNGEIKALIRTENVETTSVISEQLAQLKASLEEQGLKVSSLEVETKAQEHSGTEHWNTTDQHNQQQEMTEKARFLRLNRSRTKEGKALAQNLQSNEQTESISASGLHIIA